MDLGIQELDPPYLEVYRTESLVGYKNEIFKIKDFENYPTLTWSEYPAFIYPFPLQEEIETFGLMHYRCMLNLDQDNIKSPAKYQDRKNISELYAKFIDQYHNTVLISEPLEFGISVSEQLRINCPETHRLFPVVCKEFDRIMNLENGYSENIFNTTSKLYSRNIFISPRKFAEKWYDVSLELIEIMNGFQNVNAEDRWGAYILERLFSLYVILEIEKGEYSFETKPLVYFE